jgi:hypothetical protein
MAVSYFVTTSRLARLGGRRPLECRANMLQTYVLSLSGVSYACCKCFLWML